MAIDPVLYRTPMLDASGRLTREWIRFFQELGQTASTITNINNTTIMQGQASAFDDRTPVEPRLDTSGLFGESRKDPEPVIDYPVTIPAHRDALEILSQLEWSTKPLPAVDLTTLFEPSRRVGVTGTITLYGPTTPGSITVEDGVITAFTNPV